MADEDGGKDETGHAGASPKASAGAGRRKARMAEQLRANLQRRKQQARARRAGNADDRQGLDASPDAPES